MIYQQLVNGKAPYVLEFVNLHGMPVHFHVELEITYCIQGDFRIMQDGRSFHVRSGDIVIIGSNITHEYLVSEPTNILLLEIGPMFLKSHFTCVSEISFENPVIRQNESPLYDELLSLINEMQIAKKQNTAVSDLIISGDLFKLCATILHHSHNAASVVRKRSTMQIEKAMELIYYHYAEDLSIEKAASVTGYGKSVFCKNFKKFTGMSFHAFLNNYRISTACYLLLETDTTVDAIANMVGFKDAKTFSRVFKEITNSPPGQYRKTSKS